MSAILFPGQGAQDIGMGTAMADAYPVAAGLFARASEILNYDLLELCRSGPKAKLDQTEFAQPALFVVGMAAATVLKEIAPDRCDAATAVAGLSLGEYTAVCFAGGISFDDGVRLVQQRGIAMQAAADAVDSGMASVIGMELDALDKLCDECRLDSEVLRPANLLCPGNIAVSGNRGSLDQLIEKAPDAGAAKVIPLAVAGAFHTSIMQPAVDALAAAIESIEFSPLRIPVYSNVDAAPHTDADEIRGLLARQVVEPVRWGDSIAKMIEDGVDKFDEWGTGRVLRGTIKRIQRKFPADGFGDDVA